MFPPKLNTADQAWVRRMNRAIVLETVRAHRTLSRARLATETGLNPSTISNIIGELIQEDLIRETDLVQAATGRPGRLLELNPSGGCAMGVEINVDYLSVILTDFAANVLWRRREASRPEDGQQAIMQQVLLLAKEAEAVGAGQGLRLLGIGVGVPGLVDAHSGLLRFAPNLGWRDVPILGILDASFSCPIYVENEANAAALGEHFFGAARDAKNFIYLSAGVGLGSGIVIQGNLFRGEFGYAGEAGHMTLDVNGELCACGNRGCWETFVGPRAVERRVRRSLAEGQASSLQDLAAGDLEKIVFMDVVKAAMDNDPAALSAIQDVGHYLGVGVASLVNLFNPEMIVLGGALNLASSIIVDEVQRVISARTLKPGLESLQIIPSVLGLDACVMGAVALVLDDILREPLFETWMPVQRSKTR